MANLNQITELVKIDIPTGINVSFNDRERSLNVEIQRLIDLYNEDGYTVVEKTPVNKTSTHATVKFVIQKLI
jgi:hypothetical protein